MVKYVVVIVKGVEKKCPIFDLVSISVNFLVTASVQISLDFSFNYDSNGVNYFFLQLLVPKL